MQPAAAGAGAGLGPFEAVILIFTGLHVLFVWLNVRSDKPWRFGYLYRLKGERVDKFTIYSEVCRIGRNPNNELRLNDKSISYFHAELLRNHNGTFPIYDTDSETDIRVGMRPVNSSVLREGD